MSGTADITTLTELKISALEIQEQTTGNDATDTQAAMKEYEALVDHFDEIEEDLAPHQRRAAKKDFGHFLRLLDLAIAYHR